ncbi:GNAT family N-acetyltransferase [Nioella aestuarii]|uniref:GNAT family N-acetyltransferase n=1 Tax=Nioella aestuarii TaxID=1662864 RepID=UPI003D7F74FF
MLKYFGSPDQQLLQKKSEALMRSLKDDPRVCSHGRGVNVTAYDEDAADLTADIAAVIGVSACEAVPKHLVPEFVLRLEARGMTTDVIGLFTGGLDAVEKCREALARRSLPDDLTVRIIDRDAPDDWLLAYAEVAEPHGVLPPAAAFMRGIAKPGFAMVAFDRGGKPVACAGSIKNTHPDSVYPDQAQWGQLATDPSRQGEGIARALGAMALIESHERLGANRFKTGIRKGNEPSIRLCTSLGVTDSGSYIVAAMDPLVFPGEKLTK